MKILLLSMPDSFEHMPAIAVRMPNGALTSLAGNIDTHHRVAVADLILVQGRVRATIEQLIKQFNPDLVGLSVMTFQRCTALRVIELIRELKPGISTAVGGYDPSLAAEAYMEPGTGVDYIIRGEGEITFRELLRTLEKKDCLGSISGLSYRQKGVWHRNSDRGISSCRGRAHLFGGQCRSAQRLGVILYRPVLSRSGK